jgi:hypothetical protein
MISRLNVSRRARLCKAVQQGRSGEDAPDDHDSHLKNNS